MTIRFFKPIFKTKRSIDQFEKDQNGILKRYLRESDAWSSHLNNTKSTILDQANNKKRNKVAILGSGWLLDVPIIQLTEMFAEVYLFDICHPKKIKKQLSPYQNIVWIETDISGLAEQFSKLNKHLGGFKDWGPQLMPQYQFSLNEFDFVVSCNLLNQLDILLLDGLSEKIRLTDEETFALRKMIQQSHLELLPRNKTCLISDMEEWHLNNKFQLVNKKNLIFAEIPADQKINEWTWKFDNHFYYHPDFHVWLQVQAYYL